MTKTENKLASSLVVNGFQEEQVQNNKPPKHQFVSGE